MVRLILLLQALTNGTVYKNGFFRRNCLAVPFSIYAMIKEGNARSSSAYPSKRMILL